MGREIRMVPPNWDHPEVIRQNGRVGYQPMFDQQFEDAAKEWKESYDKWEAGERPSYFVEENHESDYQFWEYEGGPPEREYYRPWADHEATWFQVWETVSEGTPVSPPFKTKGELIDYLVENGDFWDQARRREGVTTMDCEPWSRKAAESFVNGPGFAPSMVATSEGVQKGVEALAEGGER